MSEPNKETIAGDRIIIEPLDPEASKKVIVTIKSRVADLTHELVQAANYDDEMNAIFVEKVLAAIWSKMHLRAADAVSSELNSPRIKIERAPGYQMFSFLAKVCPKRFVDRELSALHADGIAAYNERLDAKDFRGAAMVKWSMRGWMLWAVVGGAVSSFLRIFTGKAQSSE